jgi:hypothetical protein
MRPVGPGYTPFLVFLLGRWNKSRGFEAENCSVQKPLFPADFSASGGNTGSDLKTLFLSLKK